MRKNRFKCRRAALRARGLCTRCGAEKALPNRSVGILCETEMRLKRTVAPSRKKRAEKIGRLERNLEFCKAATAAIVDELMRVRSDPVR